MTISQLTKLSLYNKARDPLSLSARLFLSDIFFPKTELFKAEQQNAVERRIKVREKIKGYVVFLFFNKSRYKIV